MKLDGLSTERDNSLVTEGADCISENPDDALALPNAVTMRIIRRSIPPEVRVDRHAAKALQRCASLFLLFLVDAAQSTSRDSSSISNEQKKAFQKMKAHNLSKKDVLKAVKNIDFGFLEKKILEYEANSGS